MYNSNTMKIQRLDGLSTKLGSILKLKYFKRLCCVKLAYYEAVILLPLLHHYRLYPLFKARLFF